MMEFGWYLGEECIKNEGDSLDEVIEGAFAETAPAYHHLIRVGPMRAVKGSELVDFDALVERAEEAAYELVEDGSVDVSDRDQAAAELAAWADKWITANPGTTCNGSMPLPIKYVEGEWVYGGTASEAAACVAYASEPSPETGHVGWCWWALGERGEATSLADAKAKCLEALEANP